MHLTSSFVNVQIFEVGHVLCKFLIPLVIFWLNFRAFLHNGGTFHPDAFTDGRKFKNFDEQFVFSPSFTESQCLGVVHQEIVPTCDSPKRKEGIAKQEKAISCDADEDTLFGGPSPLFELISSG